jgi:hypothetical protein
MKILFSNDPDFISSPWYYEIKPGQSYHSIQSWTGPYGARYFRLVDIPSSCEIELIGNGAMEVPLTWVKLRTTNFKTSTGAIEYLSARIHPHRVLTAGLLSISDLYNADFNMIHINAVRTQYNIQQTH